MSQQALACYRTLLRARAAAFKGDRRATVAARDEIRKHFEEGRAETSSEAVEKRLEEGREAAQFLRSFVVQAEMNERGNFQLALGQEHDGMEAEVPGTNGGCSSGGNKKE